MEARRLVSRVTGFRCGLPPSLLSALSAGFPPHGQEEHAAFFGLVATQDRYQLTQAEHQYFLVLHGTIGDPDHMPDQPIKLPEDRAVLRSKALDLLDQLRRHDRRRIGRTEIPPRVVRSKPRVQSAKLRGKLVATPDVGNAVRLSIQDRLQGRERFLERVVG